VTTKRKVIKPKHVTETGWAVWSCHEHSNYFHIRSGVCSSRKIAWETFYLDFGVLSKKEIKDGGYRCLRTTAKGIL